MLQNVTISLHRNGDAIPCESTLSLTPTILKDTLKEFEDCSLSTMYLFESWLTFVLHQVLTANTCGPTDAPQEIGFLGFCDRGPDKTPILLDHNSLVNVPTSESLPCHFHTRQGQRISSVVQLRQLLDQAVDSQGTCRSNDSSADSTCSSAAPSLEIYAVPAGRVFMFVPKFVGEVINIDHVRGAGNKAVSLTALSIRPRVWEISNFLNLADAAELIRQALIHDGMLLRPSLVDGSEGLYRHLMRTSETGWLTTGQPVESLKRRATSLLGFERHSDGYIDTGGLQILRYNLTTAYAPHWDWISTGPNHPHDFDSEHKGGNRFATILLYLNDLPVNGGGETVFTEAWPLDGIKLRNQDAVAALRSSGDADSVLPQNTWMEQMVAKCRSRLSIVPKAGKAILFYSQLPNGEPDPASYHGGCPVLQGEKFAANLWVHNTVRFGVKGSPAKDAKAHRIQPGLKQVSFTNNGIDPDLQFAELYYGDYKFWAILGHGDPVVTIDSAKEGDVYKLKVDGRTIKSWTIGQETSYSFTF